MRRPVLALALGVLLAPQAFAWNAAGHMMVAAVAYEQLTPAARTRVNRLLQLNPAYKEWSAGRRGPQRDELIFMQAATWADEIKTKPGYTNDGERATGPDASRNDGYGDRLQHRYWHFISAPFSADPRLMLPEAPKPNVLTQIAAFRKSLASDASEDLKSYDLVWLIHLVGDAHEPMRVATRVTRAFPLGDDGGAQVSLCKKPCRNDLRAYWENLFGPAKKPEAVLDAAHALPKAFAKLSQIDDENAWAEDGLKLAQKVAYAPPVGAGSGPFTLDEDYHSAGLSVARQQLALAGTRLARLLNAQLAR
jgi:hypothetical protein